MGKWLGYIGKLMEDKLFYFYFTFSFISASLSGCQLPILLFPS